jgi:type I restriction enzyme S subunit
MFFVSLPGEDWVVSTGFAVLRPDTTRVDPRYLYTCVFNQTFTDYLISREKGAAYPAVSPEDIGDAEIPLPSLPEQRAIGHILGTFDDKIELNRRMNETLEAVALAMFNSWFVDFDPVRAKASGEPRESACRRLGLTPDLLALFPDRLVDSELGEIPEGWCVDLLGHHIEIFDSKRIPLSNREREKRRGVYPYYGAAAVMDYVDKYLFDGVHVLIGEDGSVINPDGTPVLQYVWGKFWVNNHAHVLRAKAPISNEQLLLLLRQTNIASFVTGAVQAKLSQGNLKRIQFARAPERVNEEFGRLIGPMFDAIRAHMDESATLSDTRDALLPKLITGKLPVPLEGAA